MLGRPDFIQSFDGTRLAVYDFGNRDGPVLFLVNGLGGSILTWRHLTDYFESRFRIISYDYRGIFRSGTPPDKDFSMQAHVEDALQVMAHFQVEQAVFLGWSMGVQVVLELMRRVPERATALVLLNGTPGRPLERAMPRLKGAVMLGMDVVSLYSRVLRVYARPLLGSTLPLRLVQTLGLVSSTLDESVFLRLAREFIGLDFVNFRDIFAALVEHDAWDVLPHLNMPTLLVSGTRDLFSPKEVAREAVEKLPSGELLEIADASHYALVEYPELIRLRLEKFLERHGLVSGSGGAL